MNIILNNRLSDVENLLRNRQVLSVFGMPGSGISLFLRELAKSNLAKPFYVDVFGLTELSSKGLFAALAEKLDIKIDDLEESKLVTECIKKLESLTKNKSRVAIYFGGFDQLKSVLNSDLIQSLQSLERSCAGNVVLIFGLCESLPRLLNDKVFDAALRLFSNAYYLKPYSNEELRYLMSLYGPLYWEKLPNLENSIKLSGGHFQLLLSLLGSQREISDSLDMHYKLLFKNLYDHLHGPDRTTLRRVARNTKRLQASDYLIGTGIVQQEGESFQLFSPLFKQYLLEINGKRLPVKEQRLFSLLKRNLDYTVSKQEIFDTVWKDEEVASEWALNALVYRLRKHPAFLAKNYMIENQKKLGYTLSRND